jgi:RHS repeat-associated protein
MWVYAAAGASITARLGTETGDSAAPVSNPSWSSASWQQVDITWQVGSGAPAANAVKLAVINTGSATSFRIDDVSVWETAPRSALDPNPANVPGSVTVFDARGKVIESIAPPSRPGDPTLATTSAYDALGRPTSVTVDANVSVSGNGSGLDTNLTTTTAYDDLGRATDKTDPNGHLTHAVYDRMGNVIETDVAWNETTLASSLGIKALAGYDALGELTATCSPVQVAATPAPCVADGTSDRSWIYHYDAMDHQTKATPPVNVFTALAETITEYDLGGAGHLKKTTQDTRTTTPTYDAAGRPKTTVIVDTAAGTLTTSATLDSLGRTIQVSTTGTSADTLDQAYDAVGRLSSISRSTTNLTSFVYNPDGTASSRTDGTTVNTFTYARLGQLLTATTGPAGSQTYGTYAFGLDGNLLTRTWGSASANPGMTLAYAYDGAKRPIGTSITRAGTGPADAISREYDAAGNVTAETQTFARSGGTGQATAYGGRQSFGYDAANRVETSALTSGSDSIARAYTYDADSNRTSVTDNAVLFFYYYDRTDELVAKNTTGIAPSGSGCATGNFCYDSLGNLLTSWPSASDSRDLVPTSYAYDPAGHLTTITANTTHITAYTIDALGRHASQQVDGAAVVTYSYLGTSQSIVSMTDGTTTTAAAIDAIGNRLASTVGPTTAYLLPDLHGNVVASVSSSSTPAYLSAYRYDAYGQTCGVWSATTGTIAIPWRFQGRILETSATGTDLYDFGARSYDPSLGGFTSFDSVAGSAQNPLTLNRYLYANANPTTMVDPDGHKPVACDGLGLVMGCNDGTTSGHPCDDHVHWCGNTPPPVVSPCLATSTCTPGVPTAPAPPTKPVVPPTLDDTHRQFLIMCLGAGSDLDGCLRRWLKIMHGEAAGDSSSDGPPVIVSTAVGNIDAPASIAKDAVWLAKFKQLYEGFMQRGGGWTAASARAAALAMVRQQFKGGTGAALEGISDKLGAAALLADTGLTMATCDWRDVGNCANQSSKTAVSDYAGLKVGGFVGTACVVGIATGPGDVLICGGAALIAGFVTSNVVGSVWDGVACNFDRDCPKTDDYNEAFRLLTRPDAGKP